MNLPSEFPSRQTYFQSIIAYAPNYTAVVSMSSTTSSLTHAWAPLFAPRKGASSKSHTLSCLQTHRLRASPCSAHCRKMVNVNTPLPFNLYNQQLHDPSGSASRPASAHLDPNTHRRVSYSPPRDDSASPSIPTSRSTSSLQPGDASYLPPEADPEYGRRPVLSVRLIRGAPGNGIWTRRGRSVTRGRYSRFGDDASSSGQSQLEQKVWDGNVHANGDAAPDAGGQEHRKEQIGVVIRVGDDSQADGSAESTPHPPLGLSPVADADTEADAGTVPPPDFRIEISDVGKISQSWGD